MATIHFTTTIKLAEMLNAADPKKEHVIRVIGPTRLAVSTLTFQPICEIDLEKEQLITPGNSSVAALPVTPKASRKSGKYQLTAFGTAIDAFTLKEILSEGLLALEKHSSGTLAALSEIKLTTKRIVAKDPSLLFSAEHLAAQFAEKLNDEWWYGTNNSAQETEAWLRRACDCAGVKWGQEFSISL